MVSTLLFDFGATLDGPLYWLDRFVAQYRTAGLELVRCELDPAYRHASEAASRARRVVERFGFVELVRMIVGQQIEFLANAGPERVRGQLGALDSRGRHRAVEQITVLFVEESRRGMECGRTVLAALAPRYKIGVVSNWYGNLERVLAEAGMAPFISAIADSARIGFEKPDPRIFTAALKLLGATPDQAAMIGDSLEKDCVPARRLGLRSVWYRPAADPLGVAGADHSARDGETASVDCIVTDLAELTELRL